MPVIFSFALLVLVVTLSQVLSDFHPLAGFWMGLMGVLGSYAVATHYAFWCHKP